MMVRKKIGSCFNYSERHHIYLLPEALEIDQVDGYDVTRRRVFLNEVQLVTLHRQRRWPLALILGALGAMMLVSGVVVRFTTTLPDNSQWPMMIGFAVISSIFVLPSVWLMSMPVRILTVMGPRTKAVMRFSALTQRAYRVREEVLAAIRAHQPMVTTTTHQ